MTRSLNKGRRPKNPKRDPLTTLRATRGLVGSVTDESIKPRNRTAHDRKKEKAREEAETPPNVSTVSRTANRSPR